jgi:tripartite-type tricarboxylate transporter receptor subunit TctC
MKKLFLAFAAALLVSAGICNSASAQEWPQRTIRIVVSFGPGGGADIIGRILADSLQSKLGQPVIVENKPGAGGILGNDVVAKASRKERRHAGADPGSASTADALLRHPGLQRGAPHRRRSAARARQIVNPAVSAKSRIYSLINA